MLNLADLPDDIAALKEMIRQRDVALAEQGETVSQLREELSTRGIEIEQLKLLIAKLKLYASGRVQEAACWTHARRQFFDLHVARPSAVTTEALRRIGELYAIEEGIRGKPPDQRHAVRQRQSLPLIDAIETWLRATLPTLSPQIRYDGGDHVRAQPVASLKTLLRRRQDRDR